MAVYEDEQTLSLLEKRREYGDVHTFIFTPARKIDFTPGMYSHVRLKDGEESQRVREFSIASAPSEEHVLFSTHIRKESLFKQRFGALEPGDTIDVFKIKGEFLLPEDQNTETILIAGGIGITPFRSMLIESHTVKRAVPPTLIHVAEDGYLYEEELSILPNEQKRITRRQIEETLQEATSRHADALFYVSGPPPFVLAVNEHLKKLNIPEENIKNDEFYGYEDREE